MGLRTKTPTPPGSSEEDSTENRFSPLQEEDEDATTDVLEVAAIQEVENLGPSIVQSFSHEEHQPDDSEEQPSVAKSEPNASTNNAKDFQKAESL